MQVTAYASQARTATPTAADLAAYRARAAVVVIDVTAVTSTPSVTFTVSGIDAASGKVWTLLASAAIATTGTTVLKIGPGLTAAANAAANDVIPDNIRVAPVHGNANSITYTVGVHFIR